MAQTYITKVCGIEFPSGTHEWQELTKMGLIRNCIVHTRGNIKDVKSPDKPKRILKNTKYITLENDRYIVIHRPYVEESIRNAKRIISEIYDLAFASVV